MKTVMTAVLGLSMLAASSFAAQDAPKTDTKATTKATTAKVKKTNKKAKATTAVKPAASVPSK
jgi:hypothetical protein